MAQLYDNMMISALSRPLHLGMLYNAKNDQIIPGFRVWNTEAIDQATRVKPQPETRLQVGGSESLTEKMELLDVNASLRLSFLGGLIKAGGSAHYLNSTTSSTNQCSVTMYCHTSTKFKELVTTELDAPASDIEEKTSATHVVVGVLYGADAIIEFQEKANEASNKQEIEGNLNVMIKKIPLVDISGDGRLQMSDEDKKKVQNFSCRFYGDYILTTNPTTYEEAVKVYKNLPTLMGEKGEKAVPLKVWLYPLSRLSNRESTFHIISEVMVTALEKVMDDFHVAEVKVNDLMMKTNEIKAEDIIHKLEQFQRCLRVFTTEYIQLMAELIPAVRGGRREESALNNLLTLKDESGFGVKDMNKWLNMKDMEIKIVKMYIKKLQNCSIKSPDELHILLMDPDVYTDTYVFSFTSLVYEESYLQKISQAADNFKSGSNWKPSPLGIDNDNPWYRSHDVKNTLLSTVSLYRIHFTNDKGIISFISDPQNPGASVRLYSHDKLETSNVSVISYSVLKQHACKLTLDLNTIHKNLWLSDGNRMITNNSEETRYPDHPDRFDKQKQVLCNEGLTGRCYWEVERTSAIDLAVVYKSCPRKGVIDTSFGYNDKSWNLNCNTTSFVAKHNKNDTIYKVIIPYTMIMRIGVFLDWPLGTLSFYSIVPDKVTHVYTFNTKFTEPVYPGFQFFEYSSLTFRT